MGKIAVSDPRLGFPEHRLGAGRKLERVVGEGACQADPTSPPPPPSPPTPGALEPELLQAGSGQSGLRPQHRPVAGSGRPGGGGHAFGPGGSLEGLHTDSTHSSWGDKSFSAGGSPPWGGDRSVPSAICQDLSLPFPQPGARWAQMLGRCARPLAPGPAEMIL